MELAGRLSWWREKATYTKWRIAILTFLATGLAVVLVANFTLGDKVLDRQIETLYSVSDPQFVRNMSVMLGPPLLPGNRVQTLLNGDEIFPAMLDAIRGAQKTITFETYIYWKGATGDEFTQALIER